MEKIPVTFLYRKQSYTGELSRAPGAGASLIYCLTVSKTYCGMLKYSQGQPGLEGFVHATPPGWIFISHTHPELSGQAEYFGRVVIASLWVCKQQEH